MLYEQSAPLTPLLTANNILKYYRRYTIVLYTVYGARLSPAGPARQPRSPLATDGKLGLWPVRGMSAPAQGLGYPAESGACKRRLAPAPWRWPDPEAGHCSRFDARVVCDVCGTRELAARAEEAQKTDCRFHHSIDLD